MSTHALYQKFGRKSTAMVTEKELQRTSKRYVDRKIDIK
jgi:hypothetical protein